jgi:Protein of unknown function (DUF3344)
VLARITTRPARLLGLTALLLAVAAAIGTAGAAAKVEVPFATQFSTSVRGGVATAANTLMTCPDNGGTETKCLEARAGTATGAALNNNAYAMERVDIDGDPATFDSSSATLTIPPGATVEFAGLYYGARTSKGTGGVVAPNAAARGTVLLRTPSALAYAELPAAVADSTAVAGSYVGSVDVTPLVAAAGSGEYTVANVQSGTGEDRYAGWSLVVVYSDPAAPPRSIQVFDGLASIVASEAPLQIPVTGLETPPTGTVTAEAGIVAYEGDRGGSSSDRLRLAGRELSDAANPPNNVFNSTIAVDGTNVTAKNPNYDNQLGFDSDLIQANGFLANGVTETTLEESTGIEQYLTQTIVLAVELNPVVLEPPEPPAPPAPAPTVIPPVAESKPTETEKPTEPEKPKPEHHHGRGGSGSGSGSGGGEAGGGKETPVSLEVAAPEGPVRPSAVVPIEASVAAPAGQALENLEVCNTIGPGLTRLRAPGASGHGSTVCWHLGRLRAGKRRTFATTARVDAASRRTLITRTVVRARGVRSVRRVTRLRVVPLPATACGSALSVRGPGAILLRC